MLEAAERVPVAVVSGAHRDEVVPALAAAGLSLAVGVVVTTEDVLRGKPDPAGYLLALELLADGLRAEEVTVFEDTEAGVGVRQGGRHALRRDPRNAYAGAARPGGRARSGA